ncbi:hypothetical protein DEJ21_14175 [Curtobacterium sp. MCSS17_006]|uniref:helix-turn-helix domain-containing protein n=1 Tax=Curtobacterium sp. MCSS17_006 TaxID=2175642 RepID=UPI000DA794F9|nr:helix-turn-helix domain-containing protein [Curtobacterium sp. MCSS17_006]PZE33992.1 hypothetical protein DEJ21_14175 [Curtobacterium sp. MCSS17_006]
MAHEAITWAWSLPLKMSRKFVLIALADRADEEFSCFPGQENIARMTGSTSRTVRDAIADLEDMGLLTRARRLRNDGTRSSDRYVLNVGALPEDSSAGSATGNPREGYRKSTPDLPEAASAHSNHQVNPQKESPEVDAHAASFEQVWKQWPRKNDKARALKVWLSLSKRTDMAPIIQAALAHATEHTRIGTPLQYVPYFKSWLSGEGWNDPLPVRRGQDKQPAFKKALDVVAYFEQENNHEQARTLEAAHHFLDR